MLDDRPYMRSPGYRPVSRMVADWLMISLVVIFALQCINEVYIGSRIEAYLALTVPGMRHGFVWQFITFQFLHGGPLHLLGNLLVLFFFGRFVEGVIGSRRFLFAYLAFGACGGLLQGILMLLFPQNYGMFMYGASAGTSGLFAVFARLCGDGEVRLNFILPVRASTLLWVYTGIAAFFTLVPSPRNNVAHAAHLGGILAGLAFVKLGWHHSYVTLPWVEWWRNRRRRVRVLKPGKSQAPGPGRLTRESPVSRSQPDFIEGEVDPILDKISAHGIHSLTDREREILERAQKRMSGRR